MCSITQRDLFHLGLCNIDLRTALKLTTNKRQVANKSWAWFLEHPGEAIPPEIWVGVCLIFRRSLRHLGLYNIDLRTALKVRNNKKQLAILLGLVFRNLWGKYSLKYEWQCALSISEVCNTYDFKQVTVSYCPGLGF